MNGSHGLRLMSLTPEYCSDQEGVGSDPSMGPVTSNRGWDRKPDDFWAGFFESSWRSGPSKCNDTEPIHFLHPSPAGDEGEGRLPKGMALGEGPLRSKCSPAPEESASPGLSMHSF
jgi:hypothetical protein